MHVNDVALRLIRPPFNVKRSCVSSDAVSLTSMEYYEVAMQLIRLHLTSNEIAEF